MNKLEPCNDFRLGDDENGDIVEECLNPNNKTGLCDSTACPRIDIIFFTQLMSRDRK